jgi:hypothetical protein
MSESAAFDALAASAAVVEAAGSWSDVEEGEFTPVTSSRRSRQAPVDEPAAEAPAPATTPVTVVPAPVAPENVGPYGLTNLKQIHPFGVTSFVNKITNPTTREYQTLVNPLTPSGFRIWVMSGLKVDDEGNKIAGTSDADKVVAKYLKGLSKNTALQVVALIINGTDARPSNDAGAEPLQALSSYLPGKKCLAELVDIALDNLAKKCGGEFRVVQVEHPNPLVLCVEVVRPANGTIIEHKDDGKTILREVSKPTPGPINPQAKSTPSSFAGKVVSGGGSGAPRSKPKGASAPSAPATTTPVAAHVATTTPVSVIPETSAPFDAVRLARILKTLAPFVGMSAEELTMANDDGALPPNVLRLLATPRA